MAHKTCYIIFLLFIPFFVKGQIKVDSTKLFVDTLRKNYLVNELNTEYQMKIYSDSLNNLKRDEHLPIFVFNPCFDNQPIYWKNLHTPISLRNLVIKNVYNKKVLLRISKDRRLKTKCKEKGKFKIPLIESTFNQLVLKRLKTL